MVLAYKGFSALNRAVSSSATTSTLNPRTDSEYHLMIADFYYAPAGTTLTPPTGWTLKVNANALLVYEANGTPGAVWTVGGASGSGAVYFAMIGFDKPGKLLTSSIGAPNAGVTSATAPLIPLQGHGVVLNMALFGATGFSNPYTSYGISPNTGMSPVFQSTPTAGTLRTGAVVGGIHKPTSSATTAPSRTFSLVGLSNPSNVKLARGYSFLLAEEDDLKIRGKVGSSVHNLASFSAKKGGSPVSIKRGAVKKNGVVTPFI